MTPHHIPPAVKLQRVPNQTRGDKTYYKWQITIPPKLIEELGWTEGDELDAQPTKDGLRLRRDTT